MLSSRDIQAALDGDLRVDLIPTRLGIEPYDPTQLQPASYDLTLGREFLIPNPDVAEIDVADVPRGHTTPLRVDNDGIILEPGEFVLACTRETVKIPSMLLGRVEGKSSLGRLGLIVHITAGFIDPGFHGQITLEVVNLAPWDITLYPGMRIAQIAFSRLSSAPLRVYGGVGNHYQGQTGAVESRYGHTPEMENA